MYCSDENSCGLENNESFWNFKGKLDTVDSLPLMSSPFPVLTITALYLIFVLRIGPDHMKNRQPYNLHNVIVLYNIAQVCISVYIVYLASKLSWSHGWISRTCLLEREDTRDEVYGVIGLNISTISIQNDLVSPTWYVYLMVALFPETLTSAYHQLTTIMYYYFLAKVSEVLDTIFFVTRKKFNQVTFLHVYHHAIMIVKSWGILKYEPTYPTLFIRNINSFVHVVMYTYYALSSFPSLTKYLWWKKYITSLQLVQFTLILIHFILTYATSECTPSYPLCITIFWNTTFFLGLFFKFYIDTYTKKGAKKVKIDEKKENEEIKADVTDFDTWKVKNNNLKTSELNNRKKLPNGS